MSVKVELGFIESGGSAPFLTLDHPVRGQLDNADYPLGGLGENYADVTEYVQSFTISRGKSRELDRFNAGQAIVVFNNNFREFDPTYESGPFVDQIVPRRKIRITVSDAVQFTGITDDWNLNYDPSGVSVASVVAFDAFSQLSNIGLYAFSPDEELSGARVNSALDNISWPAGDRNIDAGNDLMELQVVQEGANVLDYLTVVEQSELGFLFASKDGKIRFIDRNSIYFVSDVLFSDDDSGIQYTGISVVYGSEYLFNEVILNSTAGTATAENTESKTTYGVRQLQRTTFHADLPELEQVADILLDRYEEPEFRFEFIEVELDGLTSEQRTSLAGLELGDIVQVRFTPSDIPPSIVRSMRVTSIQQTHAPVDSKVRIGFESMQGGVPIILDSALFGILNTGVLGY